MAAEDEVPEGTEKEVYTVEIKRLLTTGVALNERWRLGGQLHRVDGPAMIDRHPGTGIVIHEWWFRHGKLHREDGPASIHRKQDSGRVSSSSWYQNDEHLRPPRRRTRPSPANRPSERGPNL